jgi:hypothetical protein
MITVQSGAVTRRLPGDKQPPRIREFPPHGRCQWIDDHGKFCAKPSNGTWCPEHRKRVYTTPGNR